MRRVEKSVPVCVNIVIIVFAVFLTTLQAAAQPSVRTDNGIYPVGLVPPIPVKGVVMTDPVFGTQVMRVTDASNGPSLGTAYSYWPTFNKDNTKIMALAGAGGVFINFNPTTFTLGSSSNAPGGIRSYEATFIWSHLDPNAAIGTNGAIIKRLSVSAGTWSTVRDLSSIFAGKFFWQISLSSDDDIIAFTLRNSSDSSVAGYAAYRISTNTVLYSVATTQLDEVQIDKSGRYLVVKTGLQGNGQIEVKVVDLQATPAPTVIDLQDGSPDYAPGHSDNGNGLIFGHDNWGNTITKRSLATPHTYSYIFQPNNWNAIGHISSLNSDNTWVLVSSYGSIINESYNNEIFLVKTDGSGAVRRFLHHYSVYIDYSSTPRANISNDGKFVAYSSNWGGLSRSDLYIAKIPDVGGSPGPTPTPTPSPTPVPTPNPTPTPAPTPTPVPGGAMFEHVVGFTQAQGSLQKTTTPYFASADTVVSLLADGGFSYKYNTVDSGRGVSVGLYDGLNTFAVVDQGTYLEIRINGAYQTDFLLDITKSITIERISGTIRIWQGSALKYSSAANTSVGVADFRITGGADPVSAGLGINSAQISLPPPSTVSIAGRITDATNRGVSRVLIQITGPTGETKASLTNPFGYYRFQNLPTGNYTFTFYAKRSSIPSRTVSIVQDTSSLNFSF